MTTDCTCTPGTLCPGCTILLQSLGTDPYKSMADLTWLAGYWEHTAPSIAPDLHPTAEQLRDVLDRTGREGVIQWTSGLALSTRNRTERKAS